VQPRFRLLILLVCPALVILLLPRADAGEPGQTGGRVIHVSPTGNDRWSGARARPNQAGTDGPLATLVGARDAVRRIKAEGGLPRGGIRVELQEGIYRISETFELTRRDGGSPDRPVRYAAAPGERVIISGGRALRNFSPVEDAEVLGRLRPEARAHVVRTHLPSQGITEFGSLKGGYRHRNGNVLQLYFDGRIMTMARWPNEGFVRIKELIGGEKREAWNGKMREYRGLWRYESDRPDHWAQETQVWLHGFFFFDWFDQRVKVKSIDPEEKTIDIGRVSPGIKQGQWYYAFNVLAELDRPGEWYLDHETGMLYFWPPGPIEEGQPAVPLAGDLVRIQDASHLVLRGLTLQEARGTALQVRGGTDIRVAGCTIRNAGAWGARVIGARNSEIVGCDIYNLGNGGLYFESGERMTLTPGNLRADNNHLHHYGLWNPVYKAGIQLNGVGNRATHNLVHHAPHFAINLRGNNHLIEFNEIHNVCSMTNDAGAIHPGGSWSQRGNVIRHNYIHHLYGFEGRGCFGVALDDQFSGILIEGNVFWKVTNAVSNGGGRDNIVVNNIFVDCVPAVRADARGLGWRKYGQKSLTKGLTKFPYKQPPWSTQYPELVGMLEDEPMTPKGGVVARNICRGGHWLHINPKARPYITVENNLVEEDPLFVDPEDGDFRLREDSPAWEIGFEPIPYDKIGPYEDPLRASWPIEHRIEEHPRREWPDWMKMEEEENQE
jgi:hypothetical protein